MANSNTGKSIMVILLAIVVLSIAFYYAWQTGGMSGVVERTENKNPNISLVKIGGVYVNVESVVDPVAQARGLSGREGLEENQGMLFVFPKSGIYPFWMNDMKFPIDIIWLSEFGRVVYIKKNATPESYPDLFVSEDLAKYVLEVPTGFAEKHSLKVGDEVEFLRK